MPPRREASPRGAAIVPRPVRATLLLTKAAVGATVTALPSVWARVGWPAAVAVLATVAVSTAASAEIVLAAARAAGGSGSYGVALSTALPPRARVPARRALAAATLAFGWGMTCVYTILIADLVGPAEGRAAFSVGLTALVLAPLSAPRAIGSSSSSAAAAIGMAAIGAWSAASAALCGVAAARHALHAPSSAGTAPRTPASLARAFATSLNGYVVHMAAPAIAADCGVAGAGGGGGAARAVVRGAILAATAVYSTIALATNALFGSPAVRGDAVENFSARALAALLPPRLAASAAAAVRAAVAASMVASYPLMHWAARDAALGLAAGGSVGAAGEREEPLLGGDDGRSPPLSLAVGGTGASEGEGEEPPLASAPPPRSPTDAAPPRALATTTALMCAAAAVVAVGWPDSGDAIAVVGGTAGAALALFLPAALAGAAGRTVTASALTAAGCVAVAGVAVGG